MLEKARLVPIDDLKITVPAYIQRAITKFTADIPLHQPEPISSAFVRQLSRAPVAAASNLRKLLFPRYESGPDVEMGHANGLRSPSPVQPVVPWNKVRVSEPQALQLWGQRIERFILALQLNITVLGQISAFYSGLTDSLVSLHGDMRNQYELEIRHFAEEITNIARSLETRKAQMKSLAVQLSEGQILQLTAESAETSAKKMETIAYKTAHETASMHIITIVTLIFLPGTFVATFFQSGVFWWKEAPENMESTWSYRGDAFAFFSYLCFPLMTATLGIWLYVWYKMRRDRRKEEQENSAAV
ncbi:hypothetical protein G7054_g1550 [Neopestalotiopsis clavispora]|nr:hypothetical protein G7054_g1550 [Neopestalotiopsis clavispora]